jgi:hypothetical protein
LLKESLFAVAVAVACSPAVAASPVPLVLGSVRDGDGAPIADALVRAYDANGGPVGTDHSDAAGTFALNASGAAATVEVTCRYCVTRRISVPPAEPEDPQPPLVLIVTRFRALISRMPDQRDFSALPYTRPADAIALTPFVLPAPPVQGSGGDVSDRGLERAYGLLLDQGASTYDLVRGDSVLADFPDRSVQRVDMEPASAAYRYGSYAGGGTFVLDARGDAPAAASFDSGFDEVLGGYTRVGAFAPAAAISRDADAGVLRRRAGLDYEASFAGGELRIGAVSADQRAFTPTPLDPQRDVNILHAEYATASRRYRTFIDASASNTHIDGALAFGTTDRSDSSAIVAGFRLEHPGPVTTAFGLSSQRYTGGYFIGFDGSTLSARVAADLAYVQASASNGRAAFDAGASFSHVSVDEYHGTEQEARAQVFLPSFTGRYELGGPFALTASASRSMRVPTLTELASLTNGVSGGPVELGSLVATGLTFDEARRVRAEATLFRENLVGYSDRQLTGVGVSVAWQIAPLVSVRVWTLHDATQTFPPALLYAPYSPNTVSRGVFWTTYDNGAVRADAIVHRDLVNGPPETDIDGDVVVRVARGIAVTTGTSRRSGRRTAYVGLRLPIGSR